MQIGCDSFVAIANDPVTGEPVTDLDRMQGIVEEIVFADQVGLDSFGIGEHHRPEYLDSVPAMILAAAASRTEQIRLTSAGP
jgi:alkanesulfonate monooxygenase SsuD/methylene tetrahydromethanopterin reductase-like flavin-dependent oxidoreductase (luciferase family)